MMKNGENSPVIEGDQDKDGDDDEYESTGS
jgi:hypothetical protein